MVQLVFLGIYLVALDDKRETCDSESAHDLARQRACSKLFGLDFTQMSVFKLASFKWRPILL